MIIPWLQASFGPLSATIGLLLLGYHLLGEPLVGRWAADRLRRARPTDPGALVAFYRLTIGFLVAGAGVVVLVVLVEPGLDPMAIGIAWPSLPAGLTGDFLGGVAAGVLIVAAAIVVVVRRGGAAVTVPDAVAMMLPATRVERWWAAAVAVTAGVAEELIYRGLFLAIGIGLFGLDPVLAAALVTVVFGLAHLYQGAVGVLLTAVLGALFAAIALATGSLLVPVLLHIAIDLRALLLSPRPSPV